MEGVTGLPCVRPGSQSVDPTRGEPEDGRGNSVQRLDPKDPLLLPGRTWEVERDDTRQETPLPRRRLRPHEAPPAVRGPVVGGEVQQVQADGPGTLLDKALQGSVPRTTGTLPRVTVPDPRKSENSNERVQGFPRSHLTMYGEQNPRAVRPGPRVDPGGKVLFPVAGTILSPVVPCTTFRGHVSVYTTRPIYPNKVCFGISRSLSRGSGPPVPRRGGRRRVWASSRVSTSREWSSV